MPIGRLARLQPSLMVICSLNITYGKARFERPEQIHYHDFFGKIYFFWPNMRFDEYFQGKCHLGFRHSAIPGLIMISVAGKWHESPSLNVINIVLAICL